VLQNVLGLAPEEIATLNGDGVIGVAE
jgi:hypothetical protein